ncbi:hypothetical protein [Polaromonas sp.]|uniref:hypothetical protein n=1 Tax=Polaromonas sp. TaxID=1869339 RepID=UPI003264199D
MSQIVWLSFGIFMTNLLMGRFACLTALLGSLLITGCATKFEKQAFNNEASAGIKKIAVQQWNDLDEYGVRVLNHPGASFGLVGALVMAADTASKTKKVNDLLDPKNTKLTTDFYAKALPGLRQAGYEVVAVPVKRGAKPVDTKEAVRAMKGQDAFLLLTFEAGYLAAGASTAYYPFVAMTAELNDSKSQAVLYKEAYHYGYNSGNKDVVHIEAAADCKFTDIDNLVANIDKTRSCLAASVDILVKQMVADLKK